MHIYDLNHNMLLALPEFDDTNDAACFVFNNLPHGKTPFMLGSTDGIEAIVYQGTVYTPESYEQYDRD